MTWTHLNQIMICMTLLSHYNHTSIQAYDDDDIHMQSRFRSYSSRRTNYPRRVGKLALHNSTQFTSYSLLWGTTGCQWKVFLTGLKSCLDAFMLCVILFVTWVFWWVMYTTQVELINTISRRTACSIVVCVCLTKVHTNFHLATISTYHCLNFIDPWFLP